MKKMFILIAIVVLAFASCKKEETVADFNTSDYSKKTINDFSIFTKKFIVEQSKSNQFKAAEPWWKLALRVAGKDITGALAGAAVGATVGTAVPGVGTVTGAGVGAIAGGVGSSLVEAGTTPKQAKGDNVINPNNEFDFIGNIHVVMLANVLSQYDEFFIENKLNTEKFYNYAINELCKLNIINIDAARAYTLTNLNSTLLYIDNNYNDDLTLTINKMYVDKMISTTVKEILVSYFTAMYNSNNFQEFVGYSFEAEDMIINSSLDETSKVVILATMSTTRHDLNYWLNALK